MELWKTELDYLSKEDILNYLEKYELSTVLEMDKLNAYGRGRNLAIMQREKPDSGDNNPDQKIPISYGRKQITTFTGYAYRPRYISYKTSAPESKQAIAENYMSILQDIFDKNNEHIKTSRAGKNTAIYGVAYEIVYIEGDYVKDGEQVSLKALPRFFSVDPREIILLYDYSPEPKKQIGIRFYRIKPGFFKVEVYYKERIELYDRTKEEHSNRWILTLKGSYVNFFREIPIVPYYFGEEMEGIIIPVIPLIDAYDILISDSMNEFSRFAYAYLVMQQYGLTPKAAERDPALFNKMLKFLKRYRIFEHVPSDADIKFLTKDIPTEFIKFMAEFIRDQIHIQSHVPDFTRMGGDISGEAIKRLLFDFENMVSSAEADFDLGLSERIRLITIILKKIYGENIGDPDMIIVSHKRNLPLDLKQFAETAVLMKNAGFSSWLIADTMPDDVIPDVQEELDRQEKERKKQVPDIFETFPETEEPEE